MQGQPKNAAFLLFVLLLAALAFGACGERRAAVAPSASRAAHAGGTVRVDMAHAAGSFSPLHALGAGIDRMPREAVDKLYAPESLKQILSAGWGAASYRLNTELHIEAWHWNPKGTFSEPGGKGYFTGSASPTEMIRHSFGYTLSRRGFTRNEGTEAHGFSRLTDGDAGSLWKSNPYLERAFTGEDDSQHPQWVVIDFEKVQSIDALKIAWGAPFARTYQVQYWTGEDAMKKPTRGEWRDFAGGMIQKSPGGTATHKLGPAPVETRFIRLSLLESSETCAPKDAADRRNCVGYAIHEIYAGTLDARGDFHDLTRHSADQSQTATFCSSVDPWHEPANLAEHGDQSGLDLFYTSGVTRGLPAMIPVAVLYGTPEDAAAEIAYVEKRGYPISYVELGEEPDGQYMTPEHYGALYLQWATAIHRVDPKLKLGGPVFTGVNEDIKVWADARGGTSWLGRFIQYLKTHGRLSDLAFMSFEHYPYEPCAYDWNALYDEPKLIGHILQAWRDDGLPPSVPMLVTEVNIAWRANQPFVDTFGALWLADYVGAFFTAGGSGSFYFHYMPLPISRDCDGTAGGFTMFTADGDYGIKQPTSQYFASRLLTEEWAQPGEAANRLFPAASDLKDDKGRVVVTAYALARPDGQWSVLLVNKDAENGHSVDIVFQDGDGKRPRSFSPGVAMATFGAEQFTWHANGDDGHASPDGPIAISHPAGGAGARFTLPRASISVLRGTLQ
jgi:hypothetical protein